MANKKLNAILTIGGAVSSTLGSAFGSVKSKLADIGSEVRKLNGQQKLLNNAIGEMAKRGKSVNDLVAKYEKNVVAINKLRTAQERLNRANSRSTAIVGGVKTAATGIGAAALAGGLASRPLIGAAIHRENVETVIRNSGVSKEDAQHMIDAANSAKQFGVSTTKATDTVSELRTALGDAHHAIETLPTALKAISGLALYDRLHHTDMASGDSAYQMAKVAEERGGAADPAAMRAKYDWAFKALTGSNGKVTIADMLQSQRTGKGAAQAMSDESFFGDTFLQQAMGADRYGTSSSSLVNAWIGGHQTHGAFDHMMKLGILDKNHVKFDKTGRVKAVDPDALVNAKLFLSDPQKWVDQYLAPIAKSQGVDMDDPASIMKFANAIASNPNAANMILSRLRFRSNIWKDRNNVMQANGVDASDEMNKNSTAGKIDNARARLDDAETRMGNVLLPTFASAMETAASALEGINNIADKSPVLFKAVTWGLVGLTAALGGLAAIGATSKLAGAGLTTLQLALDSVKGNIGGLTSSLIGKAGLAFALAGVGLEIAKILGLPDTDKKQGDEDVKNGNWWAASAHLPAADFIAAGYKRLTQSAPPAVPPMAGANGFQKVAGDSTFNFNITQQPGQDQKALADEVMRRIKSQQGVDSRSRLYDGAAAQ